MAEQEDKGDMERFAFGAMPMCWGCWWYVGGMTCRAFAMYDPAIPIPDDIMSGLDPHAEPFPGDNGRQFVPKDADPPPEEWY